MVLAEIGEPLLVEFYLWALIHSTRDSRYMNPNIRWWNIVREKVEVRMTTSLALRICNLYLLKLVICNLRSSRNVHEWRPAVIRMWDLLAWRLKIWNLKFSNVQDMCMSDNLQSSECGVWVWEFGMTPLPVSSSIRFCICLDLHLYLCTYLSIAFVSLRLHTFSVSKVSAASFVLFLYKSRSWIVN